MKKYTVWVSKTNFYYVEVEANSKEEAEQKIIEDNLDVEDDPKYIWDDEECEVYKVEGPWK